MPRPRPQCPTCHAPLFVALIPDAQVPQPPAWVCQACGWQHPLPRVEPPRRRPWPRCTACAQRVPPDDLPLSIWVEGETFGDRQLFHAACWVHWHVADPAATDLVSADPAR